MRFLILVVILFCGANSTFAEFILKHEGRALLGVPLDTSNGYFFETCEGAKIKLKKGVVLTYEENKHCKPILNENNPLPLRGPGNEYVSPPQPRERSSPKPRVYSMPSIDDLPYLYNSPLSIDDRLTI